MVVRVAFGVGCGDLYGVARDTLSRILGIDEMEFLLMAQLRTEKVRVLDIGKYAGL